jgi:signal transduction histidine kinase
MTGAFVLPARQEDNRYSTWRMCGWIGTRNAGLCRLVADPDLRRPVVAHQIPKETGWPESEYGPPGSTRSFKTEIADSARGLLAAMREIVWAIDPQRASLDNLAAQIRQFTSDLLEAQEIRWEFRVPEEMDRIKLDPEQRRQLLLIFKEALHNIERHSGCTTVTLSIALSHHRLAAEIRDDGHGFVVPTGRTPRTSGRGNGLENMRKRAAHLGGHLDIRSSPGQGTHLELTIPLKRR